MGNAVLSPPIPLTPPLHLIPHCIDYNGKTEPHCHSTTCEKAHMVLLADPSRPSWSQWCARWQGKIKENTHSQCIFTHFPMLLCKVPSRMGSRSIGHRGQQLAWLQGQRNGVNAVPPVVGLTLELLPREVVVMVGKQSTSS